MLRKVDWELISETEICRLNKFMMNLRLYFLYQIYVYFFIEENYDFDKGSFLKWSTIKNTKKVIKGEQKIKMNSTHQLVDLLKKNKSLEKEKE